MHLVLIVDRSGSMSVIADEMSTEINRLINDQEKGTRVTLVDFDTEIVKRLDSQIDIKANYRLEPRGATALMDAIGETLTPLIESKEERVQVVIVTDGHENSSQKFNRGQIKELITSAKARGWDTVYLGANQDAVLVGRDYGFAAGDSITYAPNAASVSSVSGVFTTRNAAYANGALAADVAFTDEDREAALSS